jgi:hypothetical protein
MQTLLLLCALATSVTQADPLTVPPVDPGLSAAQVDPVSLATSLLSASELPHAAHAARRAGLPEEQIQALLSQGRELGIPAAVMARVLARAREDLLQSEGLDGEKRVSALLSPFVALKRAADPGRAGTSLRALYHDITDAQIQQALAVARRPEVAPPPRKRPR